MLFNRIHILIQTHNFYLKHLIKTGIEHIKKLYIPLLTCIEPAGVNTAATVLNQTQFQLKRNQFDPFLL